MNEWRGPPLSPASLQCNSTFSFHLILIFTTTPDNKDVDIMSSFERIISYFLLSLESPEMRTERIINTFYLPQLYLWLVFIYSHFIVIIIYTRSPTFMPSYSAFHLFGFGYVFITLVSFLFVHSLVDVFFGLGAQLTHEKWSKWKNRSLPLFLLVLRFYHSNWFAGWLVRATFFGIFFFFVHVFIYLYLCFNEPNDHLSRSSLSSSFSALLLLFRFHHTRYETIKKREHNNRQTK